MRSVIVGKLLLIDGQNAVEQGFSDQVAAVEGHDRKAENANHPESIDGLKEDAELSV
ncbi:MAG: hypothetical protein IH859_01690 [Chloroflexi bacterium]|nr:hypothetical protein [Chloroflexota bacterium]